MLVDTTDAAARRLPANNGRWCSAIVALGFAALVLGGCGDPTRPLITTGRDAAAGSTGPAPRTTADGFPNVNVAPVEINRQPMSAADVTRTEDSLKGARGVVQASGRATTAAPSSVDALQKIGATHAAEAAAAIEASGTPPAPQP
ncbi:hypothetical protein ACRC7T_06805 [Segnochrobactraceae bacterium EtOH-i3]